MKHRDLRDFLFRGLMFEAEAGRFQDAGIQVGADMRASDKNLLDEALAPFGVHRRNNALEMGRLYSVLHCFENEVREFIRETLVEKDGVDWLDKLPDRIKQHAQCRKDAALKDSWLEGEKTDTLGFLEFGHLAQIIIHKWPHFEDIIPSQHWMRIPVIPPSCSEGKRPPVPKESGRVFRVNRSGCSGRIGA